MTARLTRADWQRSTSADAIALARSQVRRADLPAAVEAALVAYEAVVEERKERAITYALAADDLAHTVMRIAGFFEMVQPIQRAIDDLNYCRPAERGTYRLALAGKVWRVYRREDGGA